MTFERHEGGRGAIAASVWQRGFAALMLAVSFFLLSAPLASAETRTLKLYFVHTREKAEITFKRNGRYDQDGLRKVNRFLRDWRRNEPTKMDPRLLDVVWEAYQQSGSRDYIHVISAYRSPATNSMLRTRSKGVAKKSQHMLGKAMDFYLPDVKLKSLRNIGLKMQAGGVGYYPRSGSPFVHLDVGNVRHWPKMSRSELVAVFPSGKTLHVPSDGKPLPGYNQALASYQSRKKSGAIAIASARASSDDGDSSSSGGGKGLLATLFGGGADEEEDNSEGSVAVASAASEPTAASEPKRNDSKIRVVSPEEANRVELALAPVEEEPEQIVATLPARDVPLPGAAPRPLVDIGAPAAETDIPFEVKPVEDAEIALGIPLPTRRPDYAPEGPAADATEVAMASVGGVPVPSGRPAPGSAQEALIRAITSAPLPEGSENDEVVVASLPKSTEAGAFAASAEEIIAGEPEFAYAASPRKALASRKDGTDPVKALGGVRTTTKTARPSRKDVRPDSSPIVVAAEPNEVYWVRTADSVTNTRRAAKAPSFSYNALSGAPRDVLTAGFQRGALPVDSSRIAGGNAVTFQTLARFQTN